jgi:hypothetical protein
VLKEDEGWRKMDEKSFTNYVLQSTATNSKRRWTERKACKPELGSEYKILVEKREYDDQKLGHILDVTGFRGLWVGCSDSVLWTRS